MMRRFCMCLACLTLATSLIAKEVKIDVATLKPDASPTPTGERWTYYPSYNLLQLDGSTNATNYSYILTGTASNLRIAVNPSINSSPNVSITFDNLNVTYTGTTPAPAFAISSGTPGKGNPCQVTLILKGKNTLSTTTGRPAIFVNGKSKSSLIISEESTGSLEAKGGTNSAAIGSFNSGTQDESVGSIWIQGGLVIAQGGAGYPAIGGLKIEKYEDDLWIKDGTLIAKKGAGAKAAITCAERPIRLGGGSIVVDQKSDVIGVNSVQIPVTFSNLPKNKKIASARGGIMNGVDEYNTAHLYTTDSGKISLWLHKDMRYDLTLIAAGSSTTYQYGFDLADSPLTVTPQMPDAPWTAIMVPTIEQDKPDVLSFIQQAAYDSNPSIKSIIIDSYEAGFLYLFNQKPHFTVDTTGQAQVDRGKIDLKIIGCKLSLIDGKLWLAISLALWDYDGNRVTGGTHSWNGQKVSILAKGDLETEEIEIPYNETWKWDTEQLTLTLPHDTLQGKSIIQVNIKK